MASYNVPMTDEEILASGVYSKRSYVMPESRSKSLDVPAEDIVSEDPLMESMDVEPVYQVGQPKVESLIVQDKIDRDSSEDDEGFWNQFYGSLETTIFQDNPRLSGRAIEGMGRVSGIDSMRELGENIVAEYDASPPEEKFVPRVSNYKDVDGLNSALDYMGSTIGQGVGSIAMTVGGAVAGAGLGAAGGAAVGAVGGGVGAVPGAALGAVGGGATGGAVAGSFLLNYGDTYEYLVEQEGVDPDKAAELALVPGTIMAGLDAFAVGKLLGPAKRQLSSNIIKRTGQLAVRGAGTEGATEAAQQVIQESSGEIAEVLGYATEDIEFAQRFDSVVNAMIAGALTGGAMGGATSPFKKPTEAPPPPPTDAEAAAVEVEAPIEDVPEPIKTQGFDTIEDFEAQRERERSPVDIYQTRFNFLDQKEREVKDLASNGLISDSELQQELNRIEKQRAEAFILQKHSESDEGRIPTVKAPTRIIKLENEYRSGNISQERFEKELSKLAGEVSAVSMLKEEKQFEFYENRETGPDIVREKLIAGRRRGEIDPEMTEMALWFLDQNPNVASALAISLKKKPDRRAPGKLDGAGQYHSNPAGGLMRIFKTGGSGNVTTAVHEILHHTERMMPEDVRQGIAKSYLSALSKEINKKSTTDVHLAYLRFIAGEESVDPTTNKKIDEAGLNDAISNGKIPRDYYQYFNPSEFWAVNATRILDGRYQVRGTWVSKAKQYLIELVQKAKSIFGLQSDAPILRGLQSVLDSDGTFISKDNLATDVDIFGDIEDVSQPPAVELEVAPEGPVPVFESVLGKAVAGLKQKKIGIDQVESMLQSIAKKQGAAITESEVVATKLRDFIGAAKASGQKSISKDELIRHVEDNKVEVDLVHLGGMEGSKELLAANKATDAAFDALDDEVIALARILFPGDPTDQVHRFYDDPTWFDVLYRRSIGSLTNILMYKDVPNDMRDVVNRMNLEGDWHNKVFTPEGLAPIIEARNAVNAKLDDPEYQEFVRSRKNQMQRRRTEAEDDLIQVDILQAENLKRVGRILNRIPDGIETRLAALLKFKALPEYQEVLSARKKSDEIAAGLIQPKFERTTLPGGENYQEIVLKVSTKNERILDDPDVQKLERLSPLDDDPTEFFDTFSKVEDRYSIPDDVSVYGWVQSLRGFTESHHREYPNVLAHIRMKDRVDAQGRKILFVEEVQSDWHQEGRKRGYSEEENRALISDWNKQVNEIEDMTRKIRKRQVALIVQERRKAIKIFKETGEMPEGDSPEAREFRQLFKGSGFSRSDESEQLRIEEKALREKRIKIEEKIEYAEDNGSVPDGPFKKTQEWVGLAVKTILREAAEGGYDGVAFTTGADMEYISGGKLEGQQKFYDEILPSIVKKESKGKLGKTEISIDYGAEGTAEYEYLRERGMEGIAPPAMAEFNFLELTPKVKARGMNPQKLFDEQRKEEERPFGIKNATAEEFHAQINKLKTGKAVAQLLVESAEDPSFQKLAERIIPHLDDVTVTAYGEGESVPRSIARGGARAVTQMIPSGVGASIHLRGAGTQGSGVNATTVLHELLHAATMRRIGDARIFANKDTQLQNALIDLRSLTALVHQGRREIQKQFESEGRKFNDYIFDIPGPNKMNEDEVLAWGLTDKKFQDFLQTIKVGNETAFSKFVRIIMNLLGIPESERNGLTEIIRVTDELLDAPLDELKVRRATLGGDLESVSPVAKIDTPEFKTWFGKSKVVDEAGEPLVVYHGTNAKFEAFDFKHTGDFGNYLGKGAYFTTDLATAERWSRLRDFDMGMSGGKLDPERNIVLKSYLSVNNPFVWPAGRLGDEGTLNGVMKGDAPLPDDIANDVWAKLGMEPDSTYAQYESKLEAGGKDKWGAEGNLYQAVYDVLKDKGYDGVKRVNPKDGSIEWVVFEPTQIKSVENIGTFDPEDSRMQYEQRKEKTNQPPAAAMEPHLVTKADWKKSINQERIGPKVANTRRYTAAMADEFDDLPKAMAQYATDINIEHSSLLRKFQNIQPDDKVTLYRAVSANDPSDSIKPGDWVALEKSYAAEHGSSGYGDVGSKILEIEVPAKDVIWAGTSFDEWHYAPQYARDSTVKSGHEAFVKDAIRAGKEVPEEVLKDYPHLAAKPPESGE